MEGHYTELELLLMPWVWALFIGILGIFSYYYEKVHRRDHDDEE